MDIERKNFTKAAGKKKKGRIEKGEWQLIKCHPYHRLLFKFKWEHRPLAKYVEVSRIFQIYLCTYIEAKFYEYFVRATFFFLFYVDAELKLY